MKAIKDIKYYEMLNKLRKDLINNMNLSFTGSSPPEIFIGEFNYPNVYTGILSPAVHNDSSSILSSPEEWFKARLTEKDLLRRGIRQWKVSQGKNGLRKYWASSLKIIYGSLNTLRLA